MKEINILLELIQKVNDILRDWALISKYQSLINALSANQIYNDILADISDFNTEHNIDFPYVFQKKYSLQIWINELFGHKANERLKSILDKGKKGIGDIQTIINNLNKIKSAFDLIYQQFNSLELIEEEDVEVPFLELIFDWKLRIDSINDLHKNTKDIEKHIKNLSKLTNKVVDEPEIVYMSKNSPVDIVINLGEVTIDGWVWGAVVTLYAIIDYIVWRILDRVIQVQEIRKAQLEIEKKNMLNERIKEWFEEQVTEKELDFPEKLSEELYQKYLPSSANWAKNEIEKWVKEAIVYFDKLIVNWGTVNIGVLPQPNDTEEGEVELVTNDILEKNEKKDVLLNEVKKLKSGKETPSESIESDDEEIE